VHAAKHVGEVPHLQEDAMGATHGYCSSLLDQQEREPFAPVKNSANAGGGDGSRYSSLASRYPDTHHHFDTDFLALTH
jgi:hypothetical protein